MIVARSFARIHETNLKVRNYSLMSLLFDALTMGIETRGFALVVCGHFGLLENRIGRHRRDHWSGGSP